MIQNCRLDPLQLPLVKTQPCHLLQEWTLSTSNLVLIRPDIVVLRWISVSILVITSLICLFPRHTAATHLKYLLRRRVIDYLTVHFR
jgi:hypothetical protein